MIHPWIKKIVYILLLAWISLPATNLKIFGSDVDGETAGFARIIPEEALAFFEWEGFQKDWDLIRQYPFWKKLIAAPDIEHDQAGDIWLLRYLRAHSGLNRKEFFNFTGRHFGVAFFSGDRPAGISVLFLAKVRDRELAENTMHDLFSDSPPAAVDHLFAGDRELPVYCKSNAHGETIFHFILFKNILIAEKGPSYARLRHCIHLIGEHGAGALEKNPSYMAIQKVLPEGGSNRGYISLENAKSTIRASLSGCSLRIIDCFRDRILENLSGWHAVGFRRQFEPETIITDAVGTYEQADMKESLRHLTSVPPSGDHLFTLIPASALVAESYRTDPAALYQWIVENLGPLCESMQEQFPILGIPSVPKVSDAMISSIRRSIGNTMGFALLPPGGVEMIRDIPGIPLLILTSKNREGAEDILNTGCSLFPSTGRKEREKHNYPVLHSVYQGVEIKKARCSSLLPLTIYFAFLQNNLILSPVAECIEEVIDTCLDRARSMNEQAFFYKWMPSCPEQTHELFIFQGKTVRDGLWFVSLFLDPARCSRREGKNRLTGSHLTELWRIPVQAAATIETIRGWTVLEEKTWQCNIILSFSELQDNHGFK